GKMNLSVSCQGYTAIRDRRVVIDEKSKSLALSLLPTAEVRGRLVDERNEPLFGASLHPLRKTVKQPTIIVKSFPDGEFRVRNVDADQSRKLQISRFGFRSRIVEVPAAEPGEVVDLGDIVVERGRSVRGQVVDSAGGVAGAIVSVANDVIPESALWAETDSNGRFRIDGLGARSHVLHYSAGRETEKAKVDLTENADVFVTLKLNRAGEGVTHEGIVVDRDGAPVEEARVSVGDVETRTDKGGRFVLRDVSVTHPLVVSHRDFKQRSLLAKDGQLPYRVVISREARLKVRVTVAGNKELPEQLTISLDDGRRTLNRYPRHENGVVQVSVLPEGVFQLMVSAAGFPGSKTVRVDLEDRKVEAIDVRLDGRAEPVTVEVVDEGGEAVEKAMLQISRAGRPHGIWQQPTNAYGRVKSVMLRTPDTDLHVTAKGYRTRVLKNPTSMIRDGSLTVVLVRESEN
ncbi:MAG: carboxypeptidase-like regulatory domain-containing protein, partial [Planctomycetota bacterium]